jgi:hypothetical protein
MNTTELLKDLAKTKRSQEPLRRHLYAIEHPRAAKLNDCGSYLLLREYLLHEGEVRVKNANFCKSHLLCQMCAIRRAAKSVARYMDKVSQALEANPDLIPGIITWTVKNGDDLEERFLHLKNSRQKIGRQARNQLGRKKPPPVLNEFTAVKGGVLAYEIKLGKGGLWHPHGHELVLMDRYMDQKKLSGEWHEMTGDSFVVGVSKIKGELLHGLLEVLKYVTKFNEATPEQLVEISDKLKGSRLLNSHGVLRGVTEGDIDEDDDTLDGPFLEYVAFWLESRRGYDLRGYDNRPSRVSEANREATGEA